MLPVELQDDVLVLLPKLLEEGKRNQLLNVMVFVQEFGPDLAVSQEGRILWLPDLISVLEKEKKSQKSQKS